MTLAAKTAGTSAPAYCAALSHSASLGGLSAALTQLAADPHSGQAHATISQAAAELHTAAAQATDSTRAALLASADALDNLNHQGLSAAGPLDTALQTMGTDLQKPCDYPVG